MAGPEVGKLVLPPPLSQSHLVFFNAMSIMNGQLRNIMFTLNNPSDQLLNAILPWKEDIVLFATYQLERGEQNGTPHLQGYIELKRKMRPNTLVTHHPFLRGAHFEKRMGTQKQAVDYCNKEATRVAGPWTFGDPFEDERGTRNDLELAKEAMKTGMTMDEVMDLYPSIGAKYPRFVEFWTRKYVEDQTERVMEIVPRNEFQTVLLDLLEEPPHDRHINWFFDSRGGSGKTFMAMHLVDAHGAFYTNGGKQVDITYAFKGQKIAIFDFVRDSAKYVNYGVIEQVKNGIMFNSKYESCMKRFNRPHVIVFANFLPVQGKFSADRYQVCDITDPDEIKDVPYSQLPTGSD